MLEAGEDARFIARRLVILASEDVGMADPTALLVAVAAAGAVEHVGLPEAQLNLAQAVVHLATAPKSNRRRARHLERPQRRARGPARRGACATCATATTRARRRSATAPATCTRTTTRADGSPQRYLPVELAGRRYYEPGRHGFEAEVADRQELRRDDGDDPGGAED